MVNKEQQRGKTRIAYQENRNGNIEVRNGEIIVEDPIGTGQCARIISNDSCKVYINGKALVGASKVDSSNKIVFANEEIKAKRNIIINTNIDETEAKITIIYKAGIQYKLRDSVKKSVLNLQCDEVKGDLPPIFTAGEVIKYLNENKIIFGLQREEIAKVEKDRDIKDLCVVKSVPAVDAIQDKFKYNELKYEENEESIKNIDYKNIISIESVKMGDVIAEIIKGSIGSDGITIYAKKIKSKQLRELKFKIGDGCRLEGNKIIATIDGKPAIKNNTFKVNKLYIINGDVDIKTGNINFIGDVDVKGTVTEGMSVVANSIKVVGGAFKSNISLKDSSRILGNIFTSGIKIGGQVLNDDKKVQELLSLKEQLESLVKNIIFLRERKLIDNRIPDGNLIKNLIETKYKTMIVSCVSVSGLELSSSGEQSKLAKLIRMKLIGLGPINIKKYTELGEIIEVINDELEIIKRDGETSSDLTIEYCQEANIEVIGNIFIVGKGSYTTKMFATGNIEFTKEDSVCRGGHLTAKESIKAKIVGSAVGIETKLQVEEKGHINVDVAYQHTTFIVGKRKYVLPKHSRNVHVYNDKSGEIIVDKLNL